MQGKGANDSTGCLKMLQPVVILHIEFTYSVVK